MVGKLVGSSLTVETEITSKPKNGGKPRTTGVTSVGKINEELMPLFLGKEGVTINLKGGAPGMGGPHRVTRQSEKEVSLNPETIYNKEDVSKLPIVRLKVKERKKRKQVTS
ncbi:MAG TPA: hypothetical protein VI752_01560 [Candidatus Paceibacterota bacterium]